MNGERGSQQFKVRLTLRAAGPVRTRTKHKEHKTICARGCIMLPFVPYPGLYLTMEKPRKRGLPHALYLRVRCVEWCMASGQFDCVVDEILTSGTSNETHAIRGAPYIDIHFNRLHQTLEVLGFDVAVNESVFLWELDKHPDGTPMASPQPLAPSATAASYPRRGPFGT